MDALWALTGLAAHAHGENPDAETLAAVALSEGVKPLAAVKGLRAIGMPPYNLLLHTAPLRERVDVTYHWHWEIHPRIRPIGGLELASGVPVVPIAPEEAAAELRKALA